MMIEWRGCTKEDLETRDSDAVYPLGGSEDEFNLQG